MTNTPRHAAPARPERDGYRPSRALPSRALDDLDPLPPRALGSSDAVGESPAPLLPHALPSTDREADELPPFLARALPAEPAESADDEPTAFLPRAIREEPRSRHAMPEVRPARALPAQESSRPARALLAAPMVEAASVGRRSAAPARRHLITGEPDAAPSRAIVSEPGPPAEATPQPQGDAAGPDRVAAHPRREPGLTPLRAIPAPEESPFGLDEDVTAPPAPEASPFGLVHDIAPEIPAAPPGPPTVPTAIPAAPIAPLTASAAAIPPAPVAPVPDAPVRAARVAPPTDSERVWAPRGDRTPPARSALTPALAGPRRMATSASQAPSAPPASSASRAEEAPAPRRGRPSEQTGPAASTTESQTESEPDTPTQLLRPVPAAGPRRGKPAKRRRRHMPIAAGVLAVGAAALALVVTSLPGASGVVPTQATPATTASQANARTTPSAAPTAVQTIYAAGAFAAPQTGGVKLIPSADGSLKGKVIVLDPGHNGGFLSSINNKSHYTFGAGWRPCAQAGTTTYNNIPEHTITWQLANKVVPLLLAKGATVVLTRPNDTGYGPCNSERPEIANREGASLFLSLHVDGNETTSLRGFHVTWSPRMAGGDAVSAASEKASSILADRILSDTDLPGSNYVQTLGVPIVTRTDLSVLDGIRGAPALLLETGNSRNTADVEFLTSDAGQLALAKAIAAAAEQIVLTVPANTAAGSSSPSPSAPAGASTPPTNSPTPTWEVSTVAATNDEAGPETTPTGAASAGGEP